MHVDSVITMTLAILQGKSHISSVTSYILSSQVVSLPLQL